MNNENTQERINDLFNKLYGDEVLDYDDRKIGSVEQIRNLMVNELNNLVDVDEEYLDYYIDEFKQLLKDLNKKNDYDIIEVFEHDMSAFYSILNDEFLLEELKEAYNLEKKYEEREEI